MALTKCFGCKHRVSTMAAECPECGLDQPGRHPLHEARRRKRASAGSSFEARVLEALELILEEEDTRTEAQFRTEEVSCPECQTKASRGDALGVICVGCGYPDVVPCRMRHCERSASRLARVSGRWLPICERHRGCRRCHELIDETRHEARVEIDESARLARPGRGYSWRTSSGHKARLRNHLDPVICEAFLWLAHLRRVGITCGTGALVHKAPKNSGLKVGDVVVTVAERAGTVTVKAMRGENDLEVSLQAL